MPIQLIWGNDINSCNDAIEEIIDKKVSKSWKDLNISKLNGEDINQVQKAFEEMLTPPFGDGSRVVLLRNNPIFNGKNNDMSNLFEKEYQNIPERTYLILQNIQKPDSRIRITKLIKTLIKDSIIKEQSFNLPDIWDQEGQIRFVEKQAEQLNIKLGKNAAIGLIESIGIESTRLKTELQKAKLYLKAKDRDQSSENLLEISDINNLFNEHQSNIFKIIDLLLEKNISQGLLEIHHLLNKGEPSLRLLAGLISQIRIYTIVSVLRDERDLTKITDLANISNPKRVFFIRRKIKNCSIEYLTNIMINLLNIESLIKQGDNPINVFSENLIKLI